ncbi:MAG: DUF1223 domain-containing protein [Planctomycetota bacterium]|nr:DUF1223 domain-containing protein [Planctomycetota bacterium]
MTTLLRSFLPLLLLLAAIGVAMNTATFAAPASPAPAPGSAPDAKAEQGFALVELFTSEGCSSCPSADALLARLAGDAHKSGQNVHCLSFHVDYWDRLGWKDPFSDAAYSRRQEEYARVLKIRGPYTPQMVVNGAREFVGSDRPIAEQAIEEGLSRPAAVPIELSVVAEEKTIAVECKLHKDVPVGAVLCVAWAQGNAYSSPDRGENGGRKLRHVNVVRDFRVIELKVPFEGKLTLKRPDPRDGVVVAFVQEGKTGRVIGVAAKPVLTEKP